MATPFPFPNIESLSRFAAERFGVSINDAQAKAIIGESAGFGGLGVRDFDWTFGTWVMWLKNRLAEKPGIPFGPGSETPSPTTAILHVFFTWTTEPEWMLIRLRGDSWRTRLDAARSKLSAYQSQIQPIDKTAWRVAPLEAAHA
jgi:hypothetical protein